MFASFSDPHFLPLCETGKINIQLMVEIPEDTELVEPLQDGCIWRLARGAAAVVSGAEDLVASSAKVQTVQSISLVLLIFLFIHLLIFFLELFWTNWVSSVLKFQLMGPYRLVLPSSGMMNWITLPFLHLNLSQMLKRKIQLWIHPFRKRKFALIVPLIQVLEQVRYDC